MSEYEVYYNGVMRIIPGCSLGTYARYEETERAVRRGNYVCLARSKKSPVAIYRVHPVPMGHFRAPRLSVSVPRHDRYTERVIEKFIVPPRATNKKRNAAQLASDADVFVQPCCNRLLIVFAGVVVTEFLSLFFFSFFLLFIRIVKGIRKKVSLFFIGGDAFKTLATRKCIAIRHVFP